MADPSFAILNGAKIAYAAATVHLDAPAVGFAATVFEGIRAYKGPDGGLHVFRLAEHVQRLLRSMKLLRFEHGFDEAGISAQVLDALRVNGFGDDSYIRVLAYIDGAGNLGTSGPVNVAVLARPRGRGRGADSGLHCTVSSWARIADNAMPARAKAAANYVNSRLAVMQARLDGYDTALMLGADGKVSETPAACFFMVRDGRAITPPVTAGILESITRDTILTLHAELFGSAALERTVDRSELAIADEVFLCGTGQEVAPVLAIDRQPVGAGTEGPLSRALRECYFDVARGLGGTHPEWRTRVA